jgi:hypothetical protein
MSLSGLTRSTYISLSYSLYSFLHFPPTSFLLVPNISLSTYSQKPSACVPFSVYIEGMWRSVARLVVPDVSKKPNAFMFSLCSFLCVYRRDVTLGSQVSGFGRFEGI